MEKTGWAAGKETIMVIVSQRSELSSRTTTFPLARAVGSISTGKERSVSIIPSHATGTGMRYPGTIDFSTASTREDLPFFLYVWLFRIPTNTSPSIASSSSLELP